MSRKSKRKSERQLYENIIEETKGQGIQPPSMDEISKMIVDNQAGLRAAETERQIDMPKRHTVKRLAIITASFIAVFTLTVTILYLAVPSATAFIDSCIVYISEWNTPAAMYIIDGLEPQSGNYDAELNRGHIMYQDGPVAISLNLENASTEENTFASDNIEMLDDREITHSIIGAIKGGRADNGYKFSIDLHNSDRRLIVIMQNVDTLEKANGYLRLIVKNRSFDG